MTSPVLVAVRLSGSVAKARVACKRGRGRGQMRVSFYPRAGPGAAPGPSAVPRAEGGAARDRGRSKLRSKVYPDLVKVLLVVAVLSVFAVGCADNDNSVPLHCPGARPAIEDCFTGRDFAECGGTGDPLFACGMVPPYADHPSGCRWFVAGCVAEGYVASSCAADDLCCHDDFPYTESELSQYPLLHQTVSWNLYGNGTLPWNHTDHMAVTVTVDPDLPPQFDQLTCSDDGFPYGGTPCDYDRVSAWRGDMLTITLGEPGLYGTFLPVEIDYAAAGGPVARACLFRYTDAGGPSCSDVDPPECATSGAVVVSTIDDADTIRGTVDLVFASGATLSGSFSVE